MERQYHSFDAKDYVLGRLSTEVAQILSGKNKVDYTPNIDGGDVVVIFNAVKIVLTGNKETDKKYYNYSGYMGGMKETTVKEMREKKPEEILRRSIVGMLPKNKLGRQMQKRLFIYAGENHGRQIDIIHE